MGGKKWKNLFHQPVNYVFYRTNYVACENKREPIEILDLSQFIYLFIAPILIEMRHNNDRNVCKPIF